MLEPVYLADGAHLKRGKVLLVEDSDVVAVQAGHQMQLLDVDVERVCDGDAAVEATRANVYDLILMDVQMPGLSGMEATAQIRVIEYLMNRPRARIVGISATAGQIECMDSGMDDWVCKPACYESIVMAGLPS